MASNDSSYGGKESTASTDNNQQHIIQIPYVVLDVDDYIRQLK